MNIIDFLKYFLDTHPIIFALVMLTLATGFANMLENLFYSKHKAQVDKEREKRFWK